jgi:tetratricopeptide (TPR) repeat protein
MVWVVYGQTLYHKFVSYDDNGYVYDNPVVKRGITLKGIEWAFAYGQIGHWHPVTWITHMLDCQVYGLWAGGHHLTNVLLQCASSVLLFMVLRQMTGALWRSAFVAAVFAVHPLHVESVAWVAERKDVLSGFFFMLTLGAYARYVREPRSPGRYLAVVALFAVGLMCKNMLVTLPFVLLLLDYWPLRRWKNRAELPRLALEKIPLFMLSIASCIITSLVPEKMATMDRLSFLLRVENALVSCAIYLRQLVWPVGLIVPYPNPAGNFPASEVLLAAMILTAISLAIFLLRKNRPWLVVGWLWYLGMLAPVIGIVQISTYSHADRYTYLPQIGLYIAMAWLAVEGFAHLRHGRIFAVSSAAVILAALMSLAGLQASYWKDDSTLWKHTLAVMPDNAVAHNNLGADRELKGRVDEALDQYLQAIVIKPDYPEAHNNLGNALFDKGDIDEAITEYGKALQLIPDYAVAQNNIGNALLRKGEVDDAIAHCRRAVELLPDYVEAQNNLGNALNAKGDSLEAVIHYRKALDINPGYAAAQDNLANTLLLLGQTDEAMAHYRKALDINPDLADAHDNLGNILLQKGEFGEAATQFREALKIQPDSLEAENNLAHILATSPENSLRNGASALALAWHANESTGGTNPVILATLAAAYAENGRFPEALEMVQQAIDIAISEHNSKLAASLRSQLALYLRQMPLRDPGGEK